jgi:F-type H+-transporting ATPase subunit epsilon
MTDKLSFALVSPEPNCSTATSTTLWCRSEGEFGVSPNHAPVMSVIKPGALRVINDGTERRIFVNGGFADVTPEGLTVLAEEAIDLADIAPAQLEQDLKNAQEDLRDANTDAKKDAAQRQLARLETIKAAMAR